MPERFTLDDCHRLLAESLGARPDIGLWRLTLDVALEAQDPFKPWERRKFKKAFVFAALLVAFTTAWFIYFNAWL